MMARWSIPVLVLLLTAGVAVADDAGPAMAAPPADAPAVVPPAHVPPPPEAAEPAAAPGAPTQAADPQVITKFVRDPALEEMRYQHLWVAYGAIWLIIFFFVYRTWRQGQHTASEVADLKSRLAEMEADDGRE